MKLNKRYQLTLIFCGAFISICAIVGIKSYAQNVEGYVVEGESLDTIKIGKSTADDVITNYGAEYKLINHNRYSYEMIYKNLGLSFYYCQADPNKEIFVIEIEQPFRATTKSGIILGESTFADVFRIYGKVGESSSGFQYKGIYFDDKFDDEDEDQQDARNQPQFVENTESTNNEVEIPPSGTTFASLLKIAPNVQSETLSGGFQIDGESGSENVFIIDGQEVTNFRNSDLSENNNVAENESDEVENESENQTKENIQESEADKILKVKIVKRIELIEKSGLRQCESKFPKN